MRVVPRCACRAVLCYACRYGALRGLETFVQLAVQSNTYTAGTLRVPATAHIADAPRFAYRGLMMDYSRHFYPVSFIKHTMDAMAASKLNVLHMHITDDQVRSCPQKMWHEFVSACSSGTGPSSTWK